MAAEELGPIPRAQAVRDGHASRTVRSPRSTPRSPREAAEQAPRLQAVLDAVRGRLSDVPRSSGVWYGESSGARRRTRGAAGPLEQLFAAAVAAARRAVRSRAARGHAGAGAGAQRRQPDRRRHRQDAGRGVGRVAQLLERGARPAVVLRGYGGDEPLVHQTLNPGMPVVRDADRVARRRGRRTPRERTSPSSTTRSSTGGWRASRTVVLVSAERWHARRDLLPAGPWREPLEALGRADVVVVTRKAASATRQADAVAERCRVARRASASRSCTSRRARSCDARDGTTRAARDACADARVAGRRRRSAIPQAFFSAARDAGARDVSRVSRSGSPRVHATPTWRSSRDAAARGRRGGLHAEGRREAGSAVASPSACRCGMFPSALKSSVAAHLLDALARAAFSPPARALLQPPAPPAESYARMATDLRLPTDSIVQPGQGPVSQRGESVRGDDVALRPRRASCSTSSPASTRCFGIPRSRSSCPCR